MRLLSILLVPVFVLSCTVRSETKRGEDKPPDGTSTNQESVTLDGVYRLVSETTSITSPAVRETVESDKEWKGIWFFQNGFFSKNTMRIRRTEWTPNRFPSDAGGTGFDGTAGTYNVRDGEVELNHELSFYPGATRDRNVFKWDIDGNKLILTQTLIPSRESESVGKRVIVLERIAR